MTYFAKDYIADRLRRQIVSGKFRPGERLPTRRELTDSLETNPVTLQSAMHRLAEEGLIETKGSQGTFVTPKPPHISRCAIVLPEEDVQITTPRLWQALKIEAENIEKKSENRQIKVFFTGNEESQNSTKILAKNAKAGLIAALVVAAPTAMLRKTHMPPPGHLPTISLCPPTHLYSGTPSILPDWEQFFIRAFKHLKSRRRKSPVVLLPNGSPEEEALPSQMNALHAAWKTGLELPKEHILHVPADAPQTAADIVRFLMNPAEKGSEISPVDSLVVAADDLVPPACKALRPLWQINKKHPEIVALTHFPWPALNDVPVRRLGFDIRSALESAIDLAFRIRSGEDVQEIQRLFPVFEEECGLVSA
jgi:DNA-binding transcriptional regulator YhcF (GntR family)/DNA-binding LacI/PurR family transcriptional regulator